MDAALLEFLSLLSEIESKIGSFIKKVRRYNPTHGFFRKNLDELSLEVRAAFLKSKKNNFFDNKSIKDMADLLQEFLSYSKSPIKSYENLLKKIKFTNQELKIEFEEKPEEITERIYDKGSRFDFHLDLKSIFGSGKSGIFVVDSWVNEDLLEIYLKNLSPNVNIRILAGDHPKGNLIKVGHMFNLQYKCLEVRDSRDVHDRAIFCDKNGWVLGQSVKDAARNKPTYLIKLKEPKKLKDIYEKMWAHAKKLI